MVFVKLLRLQNERVFLGSSRHLVPAVWEWWGNALSALTKCKHLIVCKMTKLSTIQALFSQARFP